MTADFKYNGNTYKLNARRPVPQTALEKHASFARHRAGSWEEFVRRFDLIDSPEGNMLWEVRNGLNVDPAHVWTVVDCDGVLYVQEGWHYVNRFGYIVARNPRAAMPEHGDAYKTFKY